MFVLLNMFGCASSGDMELRLRQLREESRNQTAETTDSLKKNIKEVENNLQKEISDVRATHNKDNLEINKTLIDQQKQIFNNRAILDETARRIYLLESIVTSRNAVAPETKAGFVTFIDDQGISISLGSINGVKAGDYFGVYKDTERIGTIRIDTVEVNSSKGMVLNKTNSISIGDKVEMDKKE
ncbi:MAG: hypothetical protein Q8M92_06070 [Candidatus Subteraquimicrobiales bacterium]|nr:hypothetical protein [Candidatus Subteraquimicrobiales bacterium]